MTMPRELEIPLGFFTPGRENAITDVVGVRVGHVTVRSQPGDDGHSSVHTGVTCIWPHESWPWDEAVYAASHVLNGHGEVIGITKIDEYGLLTSPILLTSSLSIGAVYDATVRWAAGRRTSFFMPVVGEVSDSVLSDVDLFPITPAHVEEALARASTSRPQQGAVGAGAGTICYGLKGGIGTASRLVPWPDGTWTVGTLVLTNYGVRRNLTIAGVRIGEELEVPPPPTHTDGSCIVVVATDAPMLPHQLRRLALRGSLGLTRSGGYAGHYSGEITIAFSSAARIDSTAATVIGVDAIRDGVNPETFNDLFEATVEAVNEAVLNCLFAARTTRGQRGRVAYALPIDQTSAILARHGMVSV
jgi:D-aminopeptidase